MALVELVEEGVLAFAPSRWRTAGSSFLNLTIEFPQPLHLPLPAEAGEACLAGQELLHGGLFEVALLGDEPIQPAQQRIHIAQRRRDGALFGDGRKRNITDLTS